MYGDVNKGLAKRWIFQRAELSEGRVCNQRSYQAWSTQEVVTFCPWNLLKAGRRRSASLTTSCHWLEDTDRENSQ